MGWISGGSLAGVVAEIGGYAAVFWFAVAMMVLATGCIWRLKEVQSAEPQRDPAEAA